MSDKQMSNLDTQVEIDPSGSLAPVLRATSVLGDAVAEFEKHMVRKDFRDHTIKAFGNDLKILRSFMDDSAVLQEIQAQHLNDFLNWMQNELWKERKLKEPYKPKTLSRRITTLKVFFSWLHDLGAIGTNPAESIIQQPARPRLPLILYDGEVHQLVLACQDWLWARTKPDARPYVLVSLLLQTGIKKSEAVNLLLEDIDRSQPQQPTVFIRYEDERYTHKNRTLSLHPNFLKPLEQYLAQYHPDNFLFECTPRNLEYVLEEAGQRAGIKRLQVGFETLRWTCAVRDFKQGTTDEQLRHKMGLSKVSWRETSDKIARLTGQK